MTRDDLIRMAIKCHLVTTSNRDGIYMEALERFAHLVAAADRSTFNFCPRCGKRTNDIHTCTPPADGWAYPTNNIAP